MDCSGITLTTEGFVCSSPGASLVYTNSTPITSLSGGPRRILFTDAVETKEWVGGSAVTTFPFVSGPAVHTPIDVRVSSLTKVYKSSHGTAVSSEAVVGVNPDPVDSIAYGAMPAFSSGFVHGARLCVVSGKFIRYSKAYHYDLWNPGDGFIGHQFDCLQAGSIPGCVCVAHAEGVTVYVGGDIASPDVVKKFYPCRYIPNTLASGQLSQSGDYGHVFLCADGVRIIGADGALVDASADALRGLSALNSSYSSAALHDGKYLAFGDASCVEWDINLKAAVSRRAHGIGSVAGSTLYVVDGAGLYTSSGDGAGSMIQLPFSSMGSGVNKSITDLYFTGSVIGGGLLIEALDEHSADPVWEHEVDEMDGVRNYRIKLPKGKIGSRPALRLSTDGFLRVEAIEANVAGMGRS